MRDQRDFLLDFLKSSDLKSLIKKKVKSGEIFYESDFQCYLYFEIKKYTEITQHFEGLFTVFNTPYWKTTDEGIYPDLLIFNEERAICAIELKSFLMRSYSEEDIKADIRKLVAILKQNQEIQAFSFIIVNNKIDYRTKIKNLFYSMTEVGIRERYHIFIISCEVSTKWVKKRDLFKNNSP